MIAAEIFGYPIVKQNLANGLGIPGRCLFHLKDQTFKD